ncbi:hypothetical protein AVBRAN9333_07660 [Campylobacter sp. RM9333]|uniref:hypothetical protein n=1 Tax=Campylobacter sp. RM9333 TaxID=2735731 RepID=UPI001D8D0A2B|nr:hypothetical protein [Campylobacter sp. RM9333]
MNSVSTIEELKAQNPKFDLALGVRLINSGDIIGGGYQVIFASELEISTSSNISYEDAEQSLKKMVSLMGFNAIINIVRSQHTKSMNASETAQTHTSYNRNIITNNLSSSISTTNTSSTITVNNVFKLKGTVALIGRENHANGVEIDYERLKQNCINFYECIEFLRYVYKSNQELKTIHQESKNYPINLTIILIISLIFACNSSLITGAIIFVVYFIISWRYYESTITKENNTYKDLASIEPNLKTLVNKYGEVIFDIYQLSPYITLKHVGE